MSAPSLLMFSLFPETVVNAGLYTPKGRLTTVLSVAATAAVTFGAYLLSEKTAENDGWMNKTIDKDSRKVVHTFDLEDIGSKVAYCRCWRSKKFPYCDGSHAKHNSETGDNVGPLIIKRRT